MPFDKLFAEDHYQHLEPKGWKWPEIPEPPKEQVKVKSANK